MGDVYVVKTTLNKEKIVSNLIEKSSKSEGYDIRSILVPGELRGYVLVEAANQDAVKMAARKIPYVKGVLDGCTDLSEIEHLLIPRSSVKDLSEGSIIEVIAGPFKGEKATVKRIDESKEEVTIELFEAMVSIPVTIRGEHVRKITEEEK